MRGTIGRRIYRARRDRSVVSPRACGQCPMRATVWWAVAMGGYDAKRLRPKQRQVAARIVAEGPDRQGQAE